SVVGINRAQYAFSDFEYDPTTFTAVWTFAEPLSRDKLLLVLDDTTVTDGAGLALDGEWANGDSQFPSGNSVPGGDFQFRLNVLPGDINRNGGVNFTDFLRTRSLTGITAADEGYDPFFDVDGNGGINFADALTVRSFIGNVPPLGEPIALASAAVALATAS